MEFDHVFNRISTGFQPGFNQVLMPKVRQQQTSEKISKAKNSPARSSLLTGSHDSNWKD
jgi:hypothetical protein